MFKGATIDTGVIFPSMLANRPVPDAFRSTSPVANDEYLTRFYERLANRKNSQKAIVATARKMLVLIYHMLDRGEVYDPPGVSA